jgi:putative hydroxymethylpyrimidine transport system substrate-binding protein
MNDWLPVTQQAPLWESKHKGFYKDEGLEVELIAPANPADPISSSP